MKRGIALVMSLLLCAAFTPTAFADPTSNTVNSSPATAQEPAIVDGKLLVMAPHHGNPQATIDRIRAIVAPYDIQREKVITADGADDTVIVTLTIADNARVDALIAELESEPGVTAEREHFYTVIEPDALSPLSLSPIDPATPAPAIVPDPDLEPPTDIVSLDEYEPDPTSEPDPLALPETNEPSAAIQEITPSPASALPNDPMLSRQSELFSYDSRYGANVVDAWSYLGGRDNDTTIAVIDTIWNNKHVELHDNILTNLAGTSVYGEMRPGKICTDPATHSTSVCGIASAITNNDTGMAGAAYNAKLLPIQSLLDSGGPDSWVVTALQYIDDLIESGQVRNLHVINMSFGAYSSGFSSVGERLLNHLASAHRVLTVCSGGNGDEYNNPITRAMYPSDLSVTLSVTALGQDGADCYWSDYNRNKDVTAPGQNLYRPYHQDNYSVGPGFSGTSGSAPLVSGIASIIFSVVPNITPNQVKSCLKATTVSLANTRNYRGSATGSTGAVDAAAAVQMALDLYGNGGGGGVGDGDAQTVAVPTGQTFVYDGGYHQGVVDTDAYMIVGGTSRAKDVGVYTVTVAPYDGWTWTDGTADTKVVRWRITQATGRLTVGSTTETLNLSQSQGIDIPVEYLGDGVLTATQDNNNVSAWFNVDRVDETTSGRLHVEPRSVGTTRLSIGAEEGQNYTDPAPLTVTIRVVNDAEPTPDDTEAVAIYRAYNRWSTEHLLTQSVQEIAQLERLGWNNEGVAWYAPASSTAPIYRLFNPNNGDHLYTVSLAEYRQLMAVGWRGEGAKMYSDVARTTPVYRLYNPYMTANGGAFSHLWTADFNEYAQLGSNGWSREGAAFYAVSAR